MLISRLNSENRLRGDAILVASAQTVNNYELVFDIWSNSNDCAAADILPDRGRRIWGVVYRIPERLISRYTAGSRKSLDAIEGEGSNYSRVNIDVEIKVPELKAEKVITYVGKNRGEGIKTSYKYTSFIFRGLREHRILEDYIDYVKMQVTENNPDLAKQIRNL